MNEKEITEIRRRFRAEKSNISHIVGCYVSEKKEILGKFDQSLALLNDEECDELLSLLKKTLSGEIGKNLINIEFSNSQVLEGEEHKTLNEIRNSALANTEALDVLYQRIISSITMEGNYLIILGCDKYDVFSYSASGEKSEDSSSIFTYINCAVCPIKNAKPILSYYAYENTFKNISGSTVIQPPVLGFMFPTFDGRATNIYNALLYTRNTEDSFDEFADSVFKASAPMPAAEQKKTFSEILSDTVSEKCSLEVVSTVHDSICDMIEEHKESKEKEPLLITKKNVKDMLSSCGVDDERVSAFEEKYEEQFGKNAEIHPKNIVDVKQYEVKTPDITIKVNPERNDLIETRVIDGTKYILIRAEDGVSVNGVNITIS